MMFKLFLLILSVNVFVAKPTWKEIDYQMLDDNAGVAVDFVYDFGFNTTEVPTTTTVDYYHHHHRHRNANQQKF